ncbi:hypothetical protein BGZ61DRAFT_370541 [Ilyonectria robusta]|uniref:uncharacterized protein n=1 Tax=Ilyonectria robusta TaxID=1079257 RepID=UPI001E8E50B8|nr:uncharacterized protein BGZ61DRAFT_370541 [Ilyonectria robusta]KAH8659401.1 hypothetical protein BGZ61DRAFT_370541 [Ilyonectria robusta]
MDDDTFFEKLRANYNEIRGVFRRYLSYRVYNHCEFVQIERIGENTFEPGEYRPAVPDGTNNDYTFEPIPPNPMPPITKNEFKCRFYYCFRRGEPHRHYFGFRQCPKRYTPLRSALSRIPKRNFCLDKKGQNREIFWGLLAVERPSAFKVAVYHVLILIGPVMFWFLWLFFWGHSGDLQNAAIPFLTVCTLLSMFWFPMIHIS